jgi:hypothetical protein
MEVIDGVPPAEYGDKACLVVNATTRSVLGTTKPFGSVTAGYGSFGTSNGTVTFGIGSSKFGNFLSVDGVNSGRFLDSPEFFPIHDKGNVENLLTDSITRLMLPTPSISTGGCRGRGFRFPTRGVSASLR